MKVRLPRPLAFLATGHAQQSFGSGRTTAGIAEWLQLLFRDSARSGIIRNAYGTSSVVYAACRRRADTLSEARLKVFVNDRWVGENHPVQRSLDNIGFNKGQADFWKSVETRLCLDGESWDRIEKPNRFDPSTWTFHELPAAKMTVLPNDRGYVFDEHGSERRVYLPDEIVYIHHYNPFKPERGLSPLQPSREAIEAAIEMMRANRQIFKNGVLSSSLAFISKERLDAEEIDEFYERLEKRLSKPNRPIVASGEDWDVRNMGFSSKDMEFVNGLLWNLAEVARCLDVPRPLIGDTTGSIYSNVQELIKDFTERTMAREWRWIADHWTENFVPILPPGHRDVKLEFDLGEVTGMQESQDDVIDRIIRELDAGLLTLDEARKERGRPPVPTEEQPEPPDEPDDSEEDTEE